MEMQNLTSSNPTSSSPAVITLKRILPILHCEHRSFEYIPSRIAIPASSEGYLALFSNEANLILPLDVATDDWCAIESNGFEHLDENGPLEAIYAYAKFFVIGQSSTDEKTRKKSRIGGGCEIKVQCFDFSTRKWSRVGTFVAPTNAELIAAAVTRKQGNSRIRLVVFCANGQLIETAIDPQLDQVKKVRRCNTSDAPPLLATCGATIDECATLKANDWKWLERRAFLDVIDNRILWLGLSNCAYDTMHILDLSSGVTVSRQWTSIRVPRNDRDDLHELSHRQGGRVAYLPHYQRLLLFLSDVSTDALIANALTPSSQTDAVSETKVWSVSLSALDQGWTFVGVIPNSDVTWVSGGGSEDLYCLNRTITKQGHTQQNFMRFFIGPPSLKYLSQMAVIRALDPLTKQIQRRNLFEQLSKRIPCDAVESLWCRTKTDRGVLKQLSKGMGMYRDYAEDDDKPSFFKKLAGWFETD